MNMKILYKLSSFLLVLSLVILPTAPAFAQLGDVTPPPVETPPAPPVEPTPPPAEVTPEPVVEPVVEVVAPVVASDTTPPAISGVANLSLGLNEGTIAWTTDELAISTLEYGTTQSYGSQATLGVSALLAHTAVLTGLTTNTVYYYCIHATDLAGNVANSCGHSFTTAATEVIVDATPPDISLVTVTGVSTDSVTISWTTDKVANAEIEYGTTAGYGEVTPLDTALALTHSVTLTGLTPNTEYHYRIRSSDEIGNVATSPDNTFTTTAVPASGASVTAPEMNVSTGVMDTSATLLISGVETATVASSSVTIAWTTDLSSDSQIEYGVSEDLGTLTTLSSALVTSHSVTISNLAPNTNYIYRIKSKPTGATLATVSGYHEFTTLSHSTPVVAPANITSVGTPPVTSSGATITWTTDKGASSQVEYGLGTGYGETGTANSALVTSHSISLSGLDPATTYHYRVKSVDEASNITFSEDYTFTTASLTQSGVNTTETVSISAPTAISTLAVGGYDQSSAALEWNVASVNADQSLEYEVRYSTSPITTDNYGSATTAQLTPIYHGDLSPEGTLRTYIVAGLNPNTTYYFALKSKHQHSEWSPISNTVSITTTRTTSVNNEVAVIPGLSGSGSSGSGSSVVSGGYGGGTGGNAASSFEPTLVKAEPADNQIIFEWNNPGESNFVRTVVVRKVGSYPTSPSDGQTLYEGRSDTFTDTNVENGKTYYYSVYSYNHSKTYSAPVRVSLAPTAGNRQITFNESGSLISATPVFHFVHPHKKGDKDIEIEHLQEILVAENVFAEKYITGYFGSLTEAALKRFQSKHSLPQTGAIDAATQAKLNIVSQAETRLEIPGDFIVFAKDMKFGDEGEAVKALQEYLVHEGSYPEALITGLFGKLTRNAVMKFQKKYNITPVSGYVGYKTRHRMQQLTGL